MRVALTGLTQAEFFRDNRGQDVLLFIDNIFRFTQAGAEVSSLLGRIPSAVGYQSTLEWEIGCVQDRICSTKKGSITSVQAVYVPADDLTDPAPATTFQLLDATTVLSRKISEKGIYPCVDPLDSTSRKMEKFCSQPFTVAEAFTNMPGKFVDFRDSLRGFKKVMDGEMDELPDMAFYMVGGVQDVYDKAEQLAAEAARLFGGGDDADDAADKKKKKEV